MTAAEVRQLEYRGAILLIDPRELQPEFPLGYRGGAITAGDEDAQRRAAMRRKLAQRRLKRTEFFESTAR